MRHYRKLLCAFILFSSVCYGQDLTHQTATIKTPDTKSWKEGTKQKPFFISVNAGINVPQQNYGSANKTIQPNQVNGYATMGYTFDILIGFFVSPNIAFIAKAGMDINPVNQADFVQQNGGQPTGDFQINQYLGGIYYHTALSQKSFLWVQAMAGSIEANYPSITQTNNNITYTITLSNEGVLGFSFGTGYERKLTKKVGLVGNLSYTAALISYPNYTTSYSGLSQTQDNATTMRYGAIQATVGINIHL